MAKALLGTAALGGLSYGYAKKRPTSEPEIATMLSALIQSGFDGIDTAPAYGSAERNIGRYANEETLLYSKVAIGADASPTFTIRESLADSLAYMGRERLQGLTIHNLADTRTMESAGRTLQELKSDGLIREFGVSVYNLDELNEVLDVMTPDYIQAPVNLLDRCFISEDSSNLLAEKRVHLQARSPLLQGLLVGEANLRPGLQDLEGPLSEVKMVARSLNVRLEILALNFVLRHPKIDQVVIGAASLGEMKQVFEAKSLKFRDIRLPSTENLAHLLDPRNWK